MAIVGSGALRPVCHQLEGGLAVEIFCHERSGVKKKKRGPQGKEEFRTQILSLSPFLLLRSEVKEDHPLPLQAMSFFFGLWGNLETRSKQMRFMYTVHGGSLEFFPRGFIRSVLPDFLQWLGGGKMPSASGCEGKEGMGNGIGTSNNKPSGVWMRHRGAGRKRRENYVLLDSVAEVGWSHANAILSSLGMEKLSAEGLHLCNYYIPR